MSSLETVVLLEHVTFLRRGCKSHMMLLKKLEHKIAQVIVDRVQANVPDVHARHIPLRIMWGVGDRHGQAEGVELVLVQHAVTRLPLFRWSKPCFLRLHWQRGRIARRCRCL